MAQVWRAFFTGLLLSGCAHTPAGPAAFSISLQLQAQPRGETARRTLAPGQPLHSQDSYALKLRGDQPLYVYVVRYSATAWSTRMFPLRGDFQLNPGDWLRLPADKKDYQLDDKSGDETLYVVASRAPIDADTCKRVRLLCENPGATPARADSEDPPPPPPDATPADQGDPALVKSDQEITAVQKSDKNGLAILRFRFQHLP
jgi:hypothetical protein